MAGMGEGRVPPRLGTTGCLGGGGGEELCSATVI